MILGSLRKINHMRHAVEGPAHVDSCQCVRQSYLLSVVPFASLDARSRYSSRMRAGLNSPER